MKTTGKVRLVCGSVLPWLLVKTTNVQATPDGQSSATAGYSVLRSLPRAEDVSYVTDDFHLQVDMDGTRLGPSGL